MPIISHVMPFINQESSDACSQAAITLSVGAPWSSELALFASLLCLVGYHPSRMIICCRLLDVELAVLAARYEHRRASLSQTTRSEYQRQCNETAPD